MQKFKLATALPVSVKNCKNCVYYLKQSIEEHSLCIKFGKVKTEFNSPTFDTAKECRLDPHKCGESASYYISNLLR